MANCNKLVGHTWECPLVYMVSPMASICDPYATKCTKAEPKILQVKRGQKQRNAPDSARKRRNRVRSGCWREVQRVRTDGKTGIDRHRTCLGCRLGRFAAERHWRSLTPRHALRRGAAVPRCRVLMRANEKKRGKQMLVSLFWQGQKDLNPRHAVLEWMWENAAGNGKGPMLHGFCRKAGGGRCWFGATGNFCKPNQGKRAGKSA